MAVAISAVVEPTTAVHHSFMEAMADFTSAGEGVPYANSPSRWPDLQEITGRWQSPAGFEEFVTWLRAQADPATIRPSGRVPTVDLWRVQGTRYIGRISIRTFLNDALREVGGHIGYDVRPSARKQGHATAMLAAALPVAHRLGIDPALLTCDASNEASRRIIERSGGILTPSRRDGTLAFWVATSG